MCLKKFSINICYFRVCFNQLDIVEDTTALKVLKILSKNAQCVPQVFTVLTLHEKNNK